MYVVTAILTPLLPKAKMYQWQLPEFLCKFYLFVDFGLKGVHAFLLVFGGLFLYFWYRYSFIKFSSDVKLILVS